MKLPAGHMILYPSTSLHHVRPVTRGPALHRSSGFRVWFAMTEIGRCCSIYVAIQRINSDGGDQASAVQLTGIYHNLLRRWADV